MRTFRTTITCAEHRLIRRGGEMPGHSGENTPSAPKGPEIADGHAALDAAKARMKQVNDVVKKSSDRVGGNQWLETADVAQGFENCQVRLPSKDAMVAIRFYNDPKDNGTWDWQYIAPNVTKLGDYNRNGFTVVREKDGNLRVNSKMPFWVSIENKGGTQVAMPRATAETPKEKTASAPKANTAKNPESATYTELRKQAEGQILETDFILKTLADGATATELTAAQALLARMKNTADVAYQERGTHLDRNGRFGKKYFALKNRIDALLKVNDVTEAQETLLGKQKTVTSPDMPSAPESASSPATRTLKKTSGADEMPTLDASATPLARATDKPAAVAASTTPTESAPLIKNPPKLLERLRDKRFLEELRTLAAALRSPDFAQKDPAAQELTRSKADAFEDAANLLVLDYEHLKRDPYFNALPLAEKLQLGEHMDDVTQASEDLGKALKEESLRRNAAENPTEIAGNPDAPETDATEALPQETAEDTDTKEPMTLEAFDKKDAALTAKVESLGGGLSTARERNRHFRDSLKELVSHLQRYPEVVAGNTSGLGMERRIKSLKNLLDEAEKVVQQDELRPNNEKENADEAETAERAEAKKAFRDREKELMTYMENEAVGRDDWCKKLIAHLEGYGDTFKNSEPARIQFENRIKDLKENYLPGYEAREKEVEVNALKMRIDKSTEEMVDLVQNVFGAPLSRIKNKEERKAVFKDAFEVYERAQAIENDPQSKAVLEKTDRPGTGFTQRLRDLKNHLESALHNDFDNVTKSLKIPGGLNRR